MLAISLWEFLKSLNMPCPFSLGKLLFLIPLLTIVIQCLSLILFPLPSKCSPKVISGRSTSTLGGGFHTTCELMTLKTKSPVQMHIPEHLFLNVTVTRQVQQVQVQTLPFSCLLLSSSRYFPGNPVSLALFPTSMTSTNG